MGSFRLTAKARTDMKSIAAYTQRKWGRTQRHFYIKQFDDMFHLLADNPGTGTQCDYMKILKPEQILRGDF